MKKSAMQKSILRRLLPVLALLLLILLFFNKLAFTNLILSRGDTFLYFYPYWTAAAKALRALEIPLWNPAIFMGVPLLANSQMGFFYPFNWPVWFLLDPPYAVSAAIIFHLLIAGTGTYLTARRVLELNRSAALLSALVFALGGYLTAQVEHINQLQGLAWLPWLLLVIGQAPKNNRRFKLAAIIGVGLLFSLQLLAGHTQTAFISVIAMAIWVISSQLLEPAVRKEKISKQQPPFLSALIVSSILLAGGIWALLITAVQLLPTLELTALSSRQGGLPVNEVLSFSVNPLLLTRSLLPAYGQSLFTEYVAYFPLIVLALALIGAWQWRRRPGVLSALVWIVIAFLLGLGVYNPLNWLLANLPGFNLFRVPARWLILYALGTAMLAGVGWQVLQNHIWVRLHGANSQTRNERFWQEIVQPLLLFFSLFIFLAIWGFVAGLLVDRIPIGPEAPFEAPNLLTAAAWGVEILILAAIALLLVRGQPKLNPGYLMVILMGLVVLFLFLSSRRLPYNNPTTPQAFFDLRSSTTRLMVDTADPPERLLSLSDIFFDPGDQAEIDSIYNDQLSQNAQYDYTIAVKQKEIISPNLPLLYGLSSVDGFDGGVLPTRSYTELMKLILPEGAVTTDGRLREHLDAVPDARWLDLFNTRFLITDKVGDIWYDGVFFDRQHPIELQRGEQTFVGYLPDFEATELRLLASSKPGTVQITTDTNQIWEIDPTSLDQNLYEAVFPAPVTPQRITVDACPDVQSCELTAVSLVDKRDSTFQSLVFGGYRLIHSGDVKIYENLDVLPRAFMVSNWEWEQDNAAALLKMRSFGFDPHVMAILSPQGSDLPKPIRVEREEPLHAVEVIQYLPGKIVVATNELQDAMLILSDANYPGWQATIDGQPVPVYQADVLFRALFVPAGAHEISMTFEPTSFKVGLVLTLASLAIVSIILGGLALSKSSHKE